MFILDTLTETSDPVIHGDGDAVIGVGVTVIHQTGASPVHAMMLHVARPG